MKSLQSNESGQVGVIWMVLIGLFVLGIIYVALGAGMDQIQVTNNELISNPDISYTQEHSDSMDGLFTYWWAYPIYLILLFVIYGIKKSTEKETGSL